MWPVPPGYVFRYATTNTAANARSDILARGRRPLPDTGTYIDVVVCGGGGGDVARALREAEQRKEREYEERSQLEGRAFVPFACSALGAVGDKAQRLLQQLARIVADLRALPYGHACWQCGSA